MTFHPPEAATALITAAAAALGLKSLTDLTVRHRATERARLTAEAAAEDARLAAELAANPAPDPAANPAAPGGTGTRTAR